MRQLKKNIIKNYIFTFISSVAITDAIWMLFLAHRGMSLVQIGLLESLFHMTGMTMEIPTGIIADRFGRKTSRVLGRMMGMLSTALMLSSHSFWGFALAFVCTALGYNLESGAGDALVYDTLVELNETPRYMKIKGIQEACFQSAKIISLVIGGWIATFNYELGYSISLVINALAVISALTFKEPLQEKKSGKTGLLTHIRDSIKVISTNHQILNYVIFLEIFSLFHTTLYFYSQNYFKSRGLSEAWIGIILAAGSLAGIIFSTRAHWFEKKFGRLKIIQASTIATLCVLFCLAFLPLKPLYFVALACIDGVLFVSFSDYINQLIPSQHRATLLSFQAMVFSMMMIILFPIFGLIASRFDFTVAFAAVFLAAIPTMGYNYLILSRTIKHRK